MQIDQDREGRDAGDLVPNFSTASTRDLYVRDLVAGVTSLVTVAPNGGGGGYDQGATRDAEFSADGKFLLFTDNAYLATPVTTPFNFNGLTNLFAFDLAARLLHLLSVNAAGTGPAAGGVEPFSFIVNPSGGTVLFISTAPDMVAGVIDAPATSDAFLATLPPPAIGTTTTTTLVGASTTTTTLPTCTSARCALRAVRTGPACGDEAIPASVTRALDQAATLIEQTASATPKRARKLLKRARSVLKQASAKATRAGKGKRPKLTPECATAITGAVAGVIGGLGS